MTNVVNNTQNISSSPTPSASATTSAVTTSTGIRSNPKNITRVASRGGGSGGSGANGSQACAACKYQRRRCAPDCPLAPYFPAERQKDFLNAHKLFGVSNILKVLKNVPPFQKDNAMKALIFEANIRADDPVGGCHQVIQNLHRQINLYQAQLQLVYHQIVRVQEAAIQEQQNFNRMTSIRGTNSNLNFDMLPLHGLQGFYRSNSICLGEAGSSSQIVKGKGVERFNNVEEFAAKTMMTHSNGKQPLVESKDIKPYFGSIHNLKGKGVATELSDETMVSKARIN
ncbi:lob domain-containing protein 22 [Nicotiana attenuata]|uniref:Lob domain-containing protein 22 n=1 Tax=Nicotiana attenuata TaxID=49451 RepID=A0A1J6K524_NICAT|nr:lob domain-containing protein 22 [Nicotiana attenuata]